MKKTYIATPWVGDGINVHYHPKLEDDYPYKKWMDVTGQPSANLTPAPNMYVIEVVVDDVVLTQIEADSRYLVIWSEDA